MLHIEACSHRGIGRIAFCKSFVATWHSAILRPPAEGNKAPDRDSAFERRIESRSVDARLATGNDLELTRQKILAGY